MKLRRDIDLNRFVARWNLAKPAKISEVKAVEKSIRQDTLVRHERGDSEMPRHEVHDQLKTLVRQVLEDQPFDPFFHQNSVKIAGDLSNEPGKIAVGEPFAYGVSLQLVHDLGSVLVEKIEPVRRDVGMRQRMLVLGNTLEMPTLNVFVERATGGVDSHPMNDFNSLLTLQSIDRFGQAWLVKSINSGSESFRLGHSAIDPCEPKVAKRFHYGHPRFSIDQGRTSGFRGQAQRVHFWNRPKDLGVCRQPIFAHGRQPDGGLSSNAAPLPAASQGFGMNQSCFSLIASLLFGLSTSLAWDKPQADSDHDWPQFRGPQGSGIAESDPQRPLALDVERNLIWKVAVPAGHSSPIVVGDAIFLTGFEKDRLLTLCFDRATGSLRWRQELPVSQLERFHPQHGPASPTPTSDGKLVFSVFGSFGVIAYDLRGTEVWRQERPTQRNMFGSASSPVIIDGRLIVFTGCEDESTLQALEPATGQVIWERKKPGPASSWSTPVRWQSGDSATLLIYEPFNLRAIALSDGSELWSVPGLADEPITMPQFMDDLIFTTSYNLRTNKEAIGLPDFATLLAEADANGDGALDAEEAKTNKSILSRPDADGEGDHPLRMFFRLLDENKDGQIRAEEWPRIHAWMEPWNHANGLIAVRPSGDGSAPQLAWQHEIGVPECPTPLLANGNLYAIRNGGVVTCLDPKSGELYFQERLAAGGPYYASPVGSNDGIYLASARGTLTVLSAEKQPRVLDTIDLDEHVWATPALADQHIVIRGEKHLWLFGPE